jgi:hypothetical protein
MKFTLFFLPLDASVYFTSSPRAGFYLTNDLVCVKGDTSYGYFNAAATSSVQF